MSSRLRLFVWQLESLPEYSCLRVPVGNWKMWRRDLNAYRFTPGAAKHLGPRWWVGQYFPVREQGEISIRWFEVLLCEGPRHPDDDSGSHEFRL